jgi:hypothetical protein
MSGSDPFGLRSSALDQGRPGVEVAHDVGEREAGRGEREGFVAADLRRLCREPRRLGDVPCRVGHPSAGLARHVAAQGKAIGHGVVGIELDGPIGELQRFVGGVAAPFLEARHPAHVGQVRVEAFGRPGPRAGDLGLPQLRDESAHDAVRHAVIEPGIWTSVNTTVMSGRPSRMKIASSAFWASTTSKPADLIMSSASMRIRNSSSTIKTTGRFVLEHTNALSSQPC